MIRLAIVAAGLVWAGAARADAPLTPRRAEGERLFGQTCVYCHGEHGWAARDLGRDRGPDKALIAHRDDLDPAYIRFVIRRGVGDMPAYTPTDITSAQIDEVVDYLTRNRPAAH